MIDIKELILSGKSTVSYHRLDSSYKVNIFLGYDENRNMSIVITEYGVIRPVKSTKLIDVRLTKRDDGKLSLSFSLNDDTYKSIFFIFCKDMINICEKAGKELAISNAINRWNYWKKVFEKKTKNILSENEIKGLLAELIVLDEVMFKTYSISESILSWMGPLFGHKDFEIKQTWYEVKAVTENAIQVEISSLEQLDSEIDGYLIVVKLEKTNSSVCTSINLNSKVDGIINKLDNSKDLTEFLLKLQNNGFFPNPDYDNYNYNLKSISKYKVNNKFPRLRRTILNPNIGNAKYTILLNGIQEFLEEENASF